MKKFFRALSIVLCLSMFAPSVVPIVGVETVEAATKIKLNCTKKTIYEGDTFKLKIIGTKKKVKWSSSNEDVAIVSSKGVVKALYGTQDKRTCKIYASVGGKKYICKVTVKSLEVDNPHVEYINNRSVEYSKDDNSQRLFFGFLDQNKNVVSGNGTVNVRIENAGEIVYEDTIPFSEDDFNTWYWNNGSIKKYVCCINVPISKITPGKETNGKIYYKVDERNASFDEFSLNIYDLPQKTAIINLPQLPYTVLENVLIQDINGRYQHALCDINISNIETSIDGSHVKLTFTGNVTPTIDTITWVGSDSYCFTVKLIKDGVVVDSKMAMTPSIYLNNKFSCNVSFFDLDNTGEYTIQLCSYD